jgi:CRP-like cAMP-binding protein
MHTHTHILTHALTHAASPVPNVAPAVMLHAGDASSGRSLKRDAGGASPKPKTTPKAGERSIKVRHTAGGMIATGSLQASGIVSPQQAERTRKRQKSMAAKNSPDGQGGATRTVAKRKNSHFTTSIREALTKQTSNMEVLKQAVSPQMTPNRSPQSSMEQIPQNPSSNSNSLRDGDSSFMDSSASGPGDNNRFRHVRQGSIDEDEGFDEHHEDDSLERQDDTSGGVMKAMSKRFSFSAAIGGQNKNKMKNIDDHEDHHDSSAGDSIRDSAKESKRHSGFRGINIFNHHKKTRDVTANNNMSIHQSGKWSFAAKLSGRSSSRKDYFRGVMKLEAVQDSVLLFLDKGRQRKFLKKHPDLKDIVNLLMHAKIDNFLSKLPFIKSSIAADGGGEQSLGMLSSVCKYEAFSRDEPIFCEGEYGDKLYIILKGSCAVLTAASESSKNAEVHAASEFVSRENDAGSDGRGVQKENKKNDMNGDGAGDKGEGENREANPPLPGAVDVDNPNEAKGAGGRRSSMQKSNSKVVKNGKRETSIQEKKSSLSIKKTMRKSGAGVVEKMKNRFRKGETKHFVRDYHPDDVLATLGAGDYFGEMAVMVHMPRSSTVVAAEKCLALTVSKSCWKEFLEHHEATRIAVESHMKSRLMGMFSKMDIPFFEKADKKKFEQLSSGCEVLDLPKGEIIMKQGDRGDKFYVIINGIVDVDVKAMPHKPNGPKSDWSGQLTTGQYFGEIALVIGDPRKATVTTAENTVLLVINAKTFKMFFEDNPRALAEVQIRLLGERAELHSVLSIPVSLGYFKEFLDAEHSRENIDFWTECRQFESSYDPKLDTMERRVEEESNRKIEEMEVITRLWNLYIKESAEMQVNISSSMRNVLQKVIKALERWTSGEDIIMDGTLTRKEFEQLLDNVRKRNIFVDAKTEIYKLMVRDSYPRFQKNDNYKNFVKDLGLYSTANADVLSNKMAMLKEKTNAKEKRNRNSLGPLGLGNGKRSGKGGGSSMFNLKLSDRMSSVKSVLDKRKAN